MREELSLPLMLEMGILMTPIVLNPFRMTAALLIQSKTHDSHTHFTLASSPPPMQLASFLSCILQERV